MDDLCSGYLNDQRNRGLAPRTISKYEDMLNRFRNWAYEKNKRWANTLGKREFWMFQQHMRESGLSEILH